MSVCRVWCVADDRNCSFNVEELTYKNLTFNCWDVGGQHKIRKLWHHYYTGTDALIYVVDSNDATRFEEAREELHDMLKSDALDNTVLLVYANKQDLPHAQSLAVVAERLGLPAMRTRKWKLVPACAMTGEGLVEGLDWIAQQLQQRARA